MAKKAVKSLKSEEEKKIFAFLGVFLTIIGFIIALVAKRDDKYVMFYAKQGLVIFIAYVIVFVASIVLAFIPVLGWAIMTMAYLVLLAFWVIGIVYSFSGEMKPIPFIGHFAELIDL